MVSRAERRSRLPPRARSHGAPERHADTGRVALCPPMRSALRAAALVAAALALAAPTFTNPVIRGDYPDPTVLQARGAFYASATSGSWAPLFPLFRSTDLVTWRQVGALLPRAPEWGIGRFWAPELSFQRGRYVAYFSASRRRGRPRRGGLPAARPRRRPRRSGSQVSRRRPASPTASPAPPCAPVGSGRSTAPRRPGSPAAC